MTRVEEFYASRVATFLADLAAQPEASGSGSLLDNTLVPYITEVAERNHSWTRMPFLLLGGQSLGLVGGRVWDNGNGGLRSSNDPLLLSQMSVDDPQLARDALLHPIRDVWLWQLTAVRRYLVYALLLERVAG